jgi:Holliday junction resolvase
MATSPYCKGYRSEGKTIEFLERQGYVCLRSSGSRGPFDVIAFSTSETLLIQVKSNRYPTITEITAMSEFPASPAVKKVIHVWKDRVLYPIVRPVSLADLGNRRKRGRKPLKPKAEIQHQV